MKMINDFILYEMLNEKSRAVIRTTCDLYLNLVLGYILILSVLSIVGTYFIGLANLILLNKDLASMIAYKTMNGEPTNFIEFSMSFFSIINGIIAFVAMMAVFLLAIVFFGVILFWSLSKIDTLVSRLNWNFSHLFCRPLTLEERTKIQNREWVK